MINKLKNLSTTTRASLAYTIANLISKGVAVVTVPIFTRLLTSSEMGISTTYSAWYSILYSIITLSLCSGSINVAMLDYKDERDQYESSCLTLTSICSFLFLFLTLIFLEDIQKFTGFSKSILLIMCMSFIVNPALDFWYARQRYEFKYKSSVFVSITITILSAVVSILFVIYFSQNINTNLGEIKVLSQSGILILVSLVIYIYIMIKGKKFIDFSIWKYALALSLPLIVHSVSKSILDLSDRLMIDSMCGKSYAGIYGTVYSLSMLSLIVWNAINSSLIPLTFEYLKSNNIKSINEICIKVLKVFALATLLVTLFAPEILMFFTTEEYYSAVYLVPALSAGIYFTALYNIYGNFLLYKKKTKYIMYGTLISAILNIVLNYIFIGIFGYVAASYTTLLSFVILSILQCSLSKKIFGYRIINDKKVFFQSSGIIILSLVCNLLYKNNFLRYLFILVLLLVIFINRKQLKEFLSKI